MDSQDVKFFGATLLFLLSPSCIQITLIKREGQHL